MTFGSQLKAFREAAGFTQEELATIAGLSVNGVSALERGGRRRPHLHTVRALSAALDLVGSNRDAFVLSARAPARDAAADELSRGRLPVPPTTLVGRDAEIEQLRAWLADPGARLVTLTGPGGVGKTRLALETARVLATEGLSRPVFVPLASLRNPDFVGAAIAEAIGLSDVTARDLTRRVRTACDGHQLLIVLDNCEQVLEAAPLVADLLASVASLRFLATSREPLRVRGEREFPVRPLAFDATVDPTSPADLARAPAVRLFLERVGEMRLDFQLTSANGPAIATICRRLDSLPLALELVAPWLKVLTPGELERRIDDDVLATAAGSRDLPERQQTMNATVAWSYQLLGTAEQQAFRRLGALPGRFPIEAAAAVLTGRAETPVASGDVLRVLAGLIDKSLLVRAESSVPGRPLYRMLETVRAYAARELAAAGERDDALDGLARAYLDEALLSGREPPGATRLPGWTACATISTTTGEPWLGSSTGGGSPTHRASRGR